MEQLIVPVWTDEMKLIVVNNIDREIFKLQEKERDLRIRIAGEFSVFDAIQKEVSELVQRREAVYSGNRNILDSRYNYIVGNYSPK